MRPIERVLERLEDFQAHNGYFKAPCPAHEDTNPSLSISEGSDRRALLRCHAGCTFAAIMEALGLPQNAAFPENGRQRGGGGSNTPPKKSEYVNTPPGEGGKAQGCTLDAYAEYVGLPPDFLKGLGLREIHYVENQAVRMPYFDVAGEEVCVRFRVSLTGTPKIKTKKGDKHRLYGIWKLNEARALGYAILVEGESDAHVGWFHGVPVISVPGATAFQSAWIEDLEGIEKLYALVEPDEGGEAFWERLAATDLRDRLYRVELDGIKDLRDLHKQRPDTFTVDLADATGRARAWLDMAETEAQERSREAWARCEGLASSENLLQSFGEDLSRAGVVGNVNNGKLLYLALTTRLMAPKLLVNVVVKGPSSAGKSYLVEKVLDFFPEDAYHRLTAFSERALVYDDTPVARKFLIIGEADAIKGDTLTYIVRSLLSEGEIRYTTVVKDSEGLKPLHIHRDGPTGLITTTTRLKIHAENETRTLAIQADDSPALTAAIFEALANEDFHPPDLDEWRALQTWLVSGETRVTIPYGQALARKVPAKAVRMRRDFGQILNLIRAHALIHRATRELDSKGRIVATLDDYRVVRSLAVKTLSEGVEASVPKIVRETVAAVEELLKESDKLTVTIKDLQRKLGLDYGPTYRRVRMALEGGYLENREERERRPAQLLIGEALPEDEEILPRAEDLEGVSKYSTVSEGITSPSPPSPSEDEQYDYDQMVEERTSALEDEWGEV